MVYNTENGASLQKLSDKSQISGKRQWILLLEIVKKESKTLNAFQKLLEQISQSPQYNRAGRRARQTVRGVASGNVYDEKTAKKSGNASSIPKYHPSEETIFGSNGIKRQHENNEMRKLF